MEDGRLSVHQPESWRRVVADNYPRSREWFCLEACTRGGRPEPPGPYHCAVCMEPGRNMCGKCKCTPYCSKECQRVHWRECHKQACTANPLRVMVRADPAVFAGLPADCFEGHEFISIAPTGRCSSLAEVCERVVAGADDLFDLMPIWTPHDVHTPVPPATMRAVCRRFGWTGPCGFTKDIVPGYRLRENQYMYIMMSDDCFQDAEQSPGMAVSYYGQALIDAGTPPEKVRGTMVLAKMLVVKKTIQPPRDHAGMVVIEMRDDEDVAMEWLFAPLCKAEVAHLLWERLRAIEQGGFNDRMWRAEVRGQERMALARARGARYHDL